MIESTYRLYDLTHEGPSNFRPAKESALHYRFLVSGLIGVWVYWVKNDCRPKKEVRKIPRFYSWNRRTGPRMPSGQIVFGASMLNTGPSGG